MGGLQKGGGGIQGHWGPSPVHRCVYGHVILTLNKGKTDQLPNAEESREELGVHGRLAVR